MTECAVTRKDRLPMPNEFTEQLKIMEDGYPLGAERCSECRERAVVKMDGSLICLACGTADPDHDGHATDG